MVDTGGSISQGRKPFVKYKGASSLASWSPNKKNIVDCNKKTGVPKQQTNRITLFVTFILPQVPIVSLD